MKESICKYQKECPVYQGTETISSTPLEVYKNVFCKRGIKGWKNCKKYEAYKHKELKDSLKNS